MKSYSLDTNCLLALLVPGREREKNAVLKVIKNHECHVSDLVVSEVQFILSKVYDLPRHIVADNIQALLNIETVNCNRTLFRRVLSKYTDHSSLSFVDICIATQASLNNAEPLYTFDKKLSNQMDSAELLA